MNSVPIIRSTLAQFFIQARCSQSMTGCSSMSGFTAPDMNPVTSVCHCLTLFLLWSEVLFSHRAGQRVVRPGVMGKKVSDLFMSASVIQNSTVPCRSIPANWRSWPNVGLLLGQCRRRWTNSKPTLYQRIMFAGYRHDRFLLSIIWPTPQTHHYVVIWHFNQF